MTDTRSRGFAAEQTAKRYLEKQGLRFVAENFRWSRGEIDLIMEDGDILVFIEVRMRNNPTFGDGLDSITPQKQQRIARTAHHYLRNQDLDDRVNCRFDVISLCYAHTGLKIDWIRDAFLDENEE